MGYGLAFFLKKKKKEKNEWYDENNEPKRTNLLLKFLTKSPFSSWKQVKRRPPPNYG